LQRDAHQLAQNYSQKSDEELDALHRSGKLTDMAYSVLEAEMRRRGRAIPERPTEPLVEKRTLGPEHKWQVESQLSMAACFLVWSIAVPLINVRPMFDSPPITLVVSIVPICFLIRGVYALMYPEVASRYPRAILLGAIAIVPFLSIAPVSIRLALEAWPAHKYWIALTAAGLLAAATYLWRAGRYWLNRPRPVGKSNQA
jgi:hypothetical protein